LPPLFHKMRTSSSAVSYLVKGQIRKPRGGSGPSVAVCSANRETVGVGVMEAIGLLRTGKLPMEFLDIPMDVPSLSPDCSNGEPTTVEATKNQFVKSNYARRAQL